MWKWMEYFVGFVIYRQKKNNNKNWISLSLIFQSLGYENDEIRIKKKWSCIIWSYKSSVIGKNMSVEWLKFVLNNFD